MSVNVGKNIYNFFWIFEVFCLFQLQIRQGITQIQLQRMFRKLMYILKNIEQRILILFITVQNREKVERQKIYSKSIGEPDANNIKITKL